MTSWDELEELRHKLALYERNATRSSWLLRQLGRKIRNFPRDLSRRLRTSFRKRFAQDFPEPSPSARPHRSYPFQVFDATRPRLEELLARDRPSAQAVVDMQTFLQSDKMRELVAKAAMLEPDIGSMDHDEERYLPPWHDLDFVHLRRATDAIPAGDYDAVVLMPAGRMGGADLIAGILARALSSNRRVLILRTDDSQWDRPDWYPDDVPAVDISGPLGASTEPLRTLYVLLCEIGAPNIFNVNSRRAFDTFQAYGGRLSLQFKLHAYYFCADRSEHGVELGYPVWYFSTVLPHLSTAIMDSADLAQTLIQRFAIPDWQAERVKTIYTPAQPEIWDVPAARLQVERADGRRPCIFWAGRMDRQKRFDQAMDIARAMPDVDFRCWGKPVLDAPPDLSAVPSNMQLNPPYTRYDEMPLADCDGWLYTSGWDGLPTLLIDLGAIGMPIAASAVGGVPELLDGDTGWLFFPDEGTAGAVRALRDMLADPAARIARATALQQRVRERHGMATYVDQIARL